MASSYHHLLILLTLALSSNTGFAKGVRSLSFCHEKKDGRYANPWDCNSFFMCHAGGSKRMACPTGTVYSDQTTRCEHAYNATCDSQNRMLSDDVGPSQHSFCKERLDGFYIDPDYCERFFRCIGGYTHLFLCPTKLYYNPKYVTCDWPDSVPCPRTGTVVNPTPQPWTPRPWTPRPTRNPWTPRPTPRPWTTRPTPRPWTPRPTRHPWTPRPTPKPWTPRPTVNPWVSTRKPPQPTPPRPPVQFGACQRVVCYFINWAQYRPGNGKHLPSDVNPNLCTHLIYAFAKLQGNALAPFEWNDENVWDGNGNYAKAMRLKEINPRLKILLAVGGWNMGSAPFTAMVSTEQSRRQFITSSIKFLRDRGFDGLDLDWEYPANRGSPDVDRTRYSSLLKELRGAFNQEALQTGKERLLLTAAVAAGKSTIDTAYEIPVLNRQLDFINLMAYDLHGSWEKQTGHNSPLYSSGSESGAAANLNVDWAVRYWIQKGADPRNLVLGLPLYGRTFTVNAGSNPSPGVGSPVLGKGRSGTFTREGGFLAFYEVCDLIQKGGSVKIIHDQKVPYLVSGNQWVGFDDENSLREKVKYARNMNLGGVMVWDTSMDDAKGTFCHRGPWPLMNAIIKQCRAP